MHLKPLLLIYYIILIICFLASLLHYFRKSSPLHIKLFTLFILLTITIESALNILGTRGIITTHIANVFTTVEYAFYFFVLFSIIKDKQLRKILFALIFIYPVIAIFNRLFIQKGDAFMTYTASLGGALTVIFSAFGFVEVFLVSTIRNIIRQSEFWIFFGLSFYYGGSFPYYASLNLFWQLTQKDWYVLGVVHLFLNYVLYLSFTLSFVCPFLFRNNNDHE